jgi:three-Cys-motif partner protein
MGNSLLLREGLLIPFLVSNRAMTRRAFSGTQSLKRSYEDGNRSTPLLILQKVAASKTLRERLRTFFNDENEAFIASLRQEVGLIPDVQLLGHQPVYQSETASASLFESFDLPLRVPVFVFLDQFGYSDVTPALIRRIFAHQMADCVFFIRTSRFIAAVANNKLDTTMDRVIGRDTLHELRHAFRGRRTMKEQIVLDKLKQIMLREGAKYFQAFPFRVSESKSPKHHLIYLGKHERGLALMKDVMAGASSRHFDGVPLMGFSQTTSGPTLFESDLIPSLQRDLLDTFAGSELTVGQIFSAHHPRSAQFILRNLSRGPAQARRGREDLC